MASGRKRARAEGARAAGPEREDEEDRQREEDQRHEEDLDVHVDDDDEEDDDEEGGPADARKSKAKDDALANAVFGADLRQVVSDRVEFSRSDCAARLRRAPDGMAVSGHEGFRSCRVNFGVLEGHWFCEMRIREMAACADAKVAGHVRVGWSQYPSPIEAPVGFHKSGYGFRDVDGSKVNDGLREPYGVSGFVEGDVIGLEIKVDPKESSESYVRFYVNGHDQGVAFRGMPSDKVGFFATASLYQTATVDLIVGPEFSSPSALPEGARPLCELAAARLPSAAVDAASPEGEKNGA